MTIGSNPRPRPDRIAAQHNRDAAFARIARVRGASVLGAGALTAAVAAVVSAVAPGHSLGAKTRSRTVVASAKPARATRASSTRLPPLASAGQLGLQAPSSAPQSAPTQSAPTQTQSQPSAPTQSQPSAPAQPSPPVQQAAPAPSSSGPVVSGGS